MKSPFAQKQMEIFLLILQMRRCFTRQAFKVY